MEQIKIESFDGKQLHTYIWDDVKNPVGVLQIVHGSCEHMMRYENFAKFLNKNNWIVVGNDHRGHGQTAILEEDELGFFASVDGWNVIIKDLKVVNDYIKRKYPSLPISMLGHSMGSFMTRTYIIDYPETIEKVILSGTAWHSKSLLRFSRNLAKSRQRSHGDKFKDEFIWSLSYKVFNKKFKKEGNTGSEWLSIDQENVKKFNKDPLCGQIFTSAAFKDMFSGLLYIQKKKNIKKMRKDMPILLASGKNDPVGNYGKMVKKTYKAFKKRKLDVSIKLYDQLRHEILFDIKKDEIQNDVLLFLK